MEQISIAVPAQESSPHPRPAAATITDVMRLPPTTVQQHDHAAAAAYLMKHAGTTALMVVDPRAGQPAGIITAADIARAIADGKDVNAVWVDAVMTTRPAIIATTSIRDAAKMMTTRHFRHLPVAGDAEVIGQPSGERIAAQAAQAVFVVQLAEDDGRGGIYVPREAEHGALGHGHRPDLPGPRMW